MTTEYHVRIRGGDWIRIAASSKQEAIAIAQKDGHEVAWTIYDIARHLDVYWRTVEKWIRSGHINAVGYDPMTWYILQKDFDAFCETYAMKNFDHSGE